MTPEQCKAKIDMLLKQSIKDDISVPICEDHSSQAVTALSVDWTKANITYLQPSRVEELWNKAAKLLNTPGLLYVLLEILVQGKLLVQVLLLYVIARHHHILCMQRN